MYVTIAQRILIIKIALLSYVTIAKSILIRIALLSYVTIAKSIHLLIADKAIIALTVQRK